MNKKEQLVKALIRRGVIAGCVVTAFVGVYVGTDMLATNMEPKKVAADQALSKDKSEISRLEDQLEKASVAEARFADLMTERRSLDFSSSSDSMKDWLRSAKDRYRLSNSFKLNLTAEKPVHNRSLDETKYEVAEHPAMKLEFDAMSDTHVYAFLDDMRRNGPGLIRIDSLAMKRTGELNANTLKQMRSGHTPYQIDAKIEFNWIGITEKQAKPAPDASAKSPRKR